MTRVRPDEPSKCGHNCVMKSGLGVILGVSIKVFITNIP